MGSVQAGCRPTQFKRSWPRVFDPVPDRAIPGKRPGGSGGDGQRHRPKPDAIRSFALQVAMPGHLTLGATGLAWAHDDLAQLRAILGDRVFRTDPSDQQQSRLEVARGREGSREVARSREGPNTIQERYPWMASKDAIEGRSAAVV